MKNHFEHLRDVVPDLAQRRILDLGSGKGSFLLQCAQNGAVAEGLELNTEYIETSHRRAQEMGIVIKVSQGVGEKLPYSDNTFDFVNMCEVIEHVVSPKVTMKEVYRVLKKDGLVYVSVPNRFGMKDQHFDLYFVNWLPRAFSKRFISLFNKNKEYSDSIGYQELTDMHYYTYGCAKKFFIDVGFSSRDIREIKINKKYDRAFVRLFALSLYKILRLFYFDSFHFLLRK